MIVPGSAHALLLASLAGYQIPNSLRFRASNSANLRKTFSSASTNFDVQTISLWFKRGRLTLTDSIIANCLITQFGSGGNYPTFELGFEPSSDQLVFMNRSGAASYNHRLVTTAQFRDPSAWYHLVIAYDSSLVTSTDRIKIWVNGVQITSFSTATYPAQNLDSQLANNTYSQPADIGSFGNGSRYFDGYMAEVNFIDGQALTPSSFGQTDATTGVWVPKKYAGTYGTNGFYLKFADATTTTTIGNDSSGNANNWTTSGISVTSGVTFDQSLDTPTNNYCVLSQINKSTSGGTVKNAGMTWNSGGGGATYYLAQSTFVLIGKCYWECVVPTTLTYHRPAIMRADQSPPSSGASYWPGGSLGPADAVGYVSNDGDVYVGGSVVVAGATPSAGDIIQFAFNAATGELWVGRNGTWLNSGDPAAGTGEVASVSLSYSWVATICDASTQDCDFNFGQRAFSYTPPSGFKALNTQNITSTAVSTSGSFTGNASTDGPFVWINGNPATLTINGNAVTFGTHADKTAGGFKLRSSSASYNASGSNSWTATAGQRFVQSKKPNNSQVNP
jgi:hypothetical protein